VLRNESPCHIHTPEQNGAAEQVKRAVVESARFLLHNSGLPKELWAEVCNTAVYVLNRTGPKSVEGKKPLEIWTEFMQLMVTCVFLGTKCYVDIPKQKRHKWDQKSMVGRLVGYMGENDG